MPIKRASSPILPDLPDGKISASAGRIPRREPRAATQFLKQKKPIGRSTEKLAKRGRPTKRPCKRFRKGFAHVLCLQAGAVLEPCSHPRRQAWLIWQAYLLRRKERRAERLLDGLGDYLLRDIGLSRGEPAGSRYRRAAETRLHRRNPAARSG